MLVPIMSKARKFRGEVYPSKETEYAINFHEDGSITVHKNRIAGTTFKVGDEAEYGSFNLIYTGTITKITQKAITIVAYINTRNAETHRLNLHQFAWRNFDFNAARVAAYNAEESMYI